MTSYDEVLEMARLRSAVSSGRAQQAREIARLSQQEIATAVGASRSAVSSWEGGRRLPRGALAFRYLGLLDALEHQHDIADVDVPA